MKTGRLFSKNRRRLIGMISAALNITFVLSVFADKTGEKTKADLEEEGFVALFDEKTLSGWEANENPDSWAVLPDGSIRGKGKRSHLFSPKEFTDVHLRVDVKTTEGSNGGIYVRATKTVEVPFPPAYEAQVNCTARAPHRTGSLYIIAPDGKWTTPVQFAESPTRDDEWWTEEIIVRGNRIVIKVNGKTVVDYIDKEKVHARGRLALQCHDPRSTVFYKNIMAKDLSTEKEGPDAL